MYGRSALRRYQIGQNQAPDTAALPPELFAEGICRVGEHIWQLTWRERVALRWDARSLTLLETISYNREGWGICTAGRPGADQRRQQRTGGAATRRRCSHSA